MDALSSLLKDFDIGKYLPEMDSLLGKIDLFCRICVLIVPALVFLLGLKFLIWPAKGPKGLGYRNFYVTGSIKAWQYTQRFAGICWSVIGAGLLIGALLLFKKFPEKEQMEVFRSCLIYMAVEVGLVLLSRWVINIRTMIAFNIKGRMRPKYKEKVRAKLKAKAQADARKAAAKKAAARKKPEISIPTASAPVSVAPAPTPAVTPEPTPDTAVIDVPKFAPAFDIPLDPVAQTAEAEAAAQPTVPVQNEPVDPFATQMLHMPETEAEKESPVCIQNEPDIPFATQVLPIPVIEPVAAPEAEPEAPAEPEAEPEAPAEPETEPEAPAEPETEAEAPAEPETEPETIPE